MVEQERASKKQQELLSFVDGFIKGNGYGPSYREIMNGLGYKSVSTVAIHIDNLIAKGYLARRDKSARSLEVVSLRTPVPTSSAKSGISADDIEVQLSERIKSLTLSDEQRQMVKDTIELLGFTKAAATITTKEEDETNDA
jgi:SOS-response transcriptional repressor LexA